MEDHKRHLELAVVEVEGDQVTFRIAEQTHRGIEFSAKPPYRRFCGSNGIVLFSFDHPFYDPERNDIYLRGRCSSCDDEYMTVSVDKFARIMETINEYNESDGKGYEKKFPEEGDTFYCITSAMTVSIGEFGSSLDGYEFKMLDAGNCFKTFEEANAALERVKKALKGE